MAICSLLVCVREGGLQARVGSSTFAGWKVAVRVQSRARPSRCPSDLVTWTFQVKVRPEPSRHYLNLQDW